MAKSSQAWKDLEREVARRLGGQRNLKRSFNWAIEDDDVTVGDFPWKIDCKYRTRPWKHHAMVVECKRKYCRDGETAILVTKNKGERGAYVTMSLDDFAGIVVALRALKAGADGESHDRESQEDS